MRPQSWFAVSMFALFVGIAWAASPNPAGNQQAPKVGVLDVSKCFEKYNRLKDEKIALEDYLKKLRQRGEDLKKQHDQLTKDLAALSKDSPASIKDSPLKKELWTKIKQVETTLKVEEKFAESAYTDMYTDAQVNIYNDIRKLVSKIAQERGLDMVFKVEDPVLDINSEESVPRRINSRTLLHWSKSYDLTEEVIRRLNEEYKK